jgi:hypothetical protein
MKATTLIFFLLPFSLAAQFRYKIDQTIPVVDDLVQANAWAGGLNAAQINTMDLNDDGLADDLVIFDRMANAVVTFLRVDGEFQYAPQYESLFPADVTSWMLLRDYNCDGLKDLFTGDVLGIKVYTQVRNGSAIAWERFFFTTPGGGKSPVLLTKGFSTKVNLQLRFDDLPALADADNDGDLDIFSIDFGAADAIEYHRNFSVERYGTCDSLDFERVSDKWGNINICGCGTFPSGTNGCGPGGRTKHATGKSLTAFDGNGDARIDLLFSDASCTKLYYLEQTGPVDDPQVTNKLPYPPDDPVDYALFPAAYYEDIDGDGKRDLLSSPNIYVKDHADIDLRSSVWVYKNVGSDAAPAFSLVRKNFLQAEMIDMGDNAVPAPADFDGDGDTDVFVSNNADVEGPSTITVYENTGTRESPVLTINTNDFLSFSDEVFTNLKINFSDLDGDGKIDLVFTATGADNFTRLYLLRGMSATRVDLPNLNDRQQLSFNLTFPDNLSFVDVNEDGDVDILAGRSSGRVEYWENDGSEVPAFTVQSQDYLPGTAGVSINISLDVLDLDNDGTEDLVYGDHTGVLRVISNFRDPNHEAAISEIVFNERTQSYEAARLGGQVWPRAANLFNNVMPSIVVGNTLGGLKLLRHEDQSMRPDDFQVVVNPNPIVNGQPVTFRMSQPATLHIFNTLGQLVKAHIEVPGTFTREEGIGYLRPGLYIFNFQSGNKKVSRKVVVLN